MLYCFIVVCIVLMPYNVISSMVSYISVNRISVSSYLWTISAFYTLIYFACTYSGYVLTISKLRGALQTTSFCYSYTRRGKVISGIWNRQKYMVESQFETNKFSVYF